MFDTVACIFIVTCLTTGYAGLFVHDYIAPKFFKFALALYVISIIMCYFSINAR